MGYYYSSTIIELSVGCISSANGSNDVDKELLIIIGWLIFPRHQAMPTPVAFVRAECLVSCSVDVAADSINIPYTSFAFAFAIIISILLIRRKCVRKCKWINWIRSHLHIKVSIIQSFNHRTRIVADLRTKMYSTCNMQSDVLSLLALENIVTTY